MTPQGPRTDGGVTDEAVRPAPAAAAEEGGVDIIDPLKMAAAATAPAELSARPVLLLTAGRTIALAVTFATPVVLARIFNLPEFGTYKQLMLVYSTLAVIAQLGMADSLLYFLPYAPRRGGSYVMNALLVLVASGLMCAGLFVVAGPRLSRWLGNAALSGLTGLVGAWLLVTLPSAVLEVVMTARKRYLGAGVTYALSDVLRAIALLAPAVAFRRLESLLAGAVVFGAVRLVGALVYVGREFGGELRANGAALREQIAYALPFLLSVVFLMLLSNLHYYVVAASVSAATFAIYAVGCFQIPFVDLLLTPTQNVMMVRMREALTAGRPDAVLATWHDATHKLALFFLPIIGLLVVTARELIPFLFTVRYSASIPIFMVWAVAHLPVVLATEGVLRAHADTRALAVLYAIQLLLTAGLLLPLMSVFGLIGAVLATGFAAGIGRTLGLFRTRRLMGVTLAQLLPWRGLGEAMGAAAVAGLVAAAAKVHLAAGPLLLLVATSCVYAATYVGILAARRLLDPGTWQTAGWRIRFGLKGQ